MDIYNIWYEFINDEKYKKFILNGMNLLVMKNIKKKIFHKTITK